MELPALIETLRVHPDGSVPLLPWHLQRLQKSCQALGYRLDLEAWLDTLQQHIALYPGQARRMRMLHYAAGHSSASSSPLTELATPVTLTLAPQPLAGDRFLCHKTTYRPWFDEAQAFLQLQPKYFDIIFTDSQLWVLEGSRSNIYVQAGDGQWLTPPLRDNAVLPGVQRQALLDQGLVIERAISLAELRQATGLRISNALRGWQDACLAQDDIDGSISR